MSIKILGTGSFVPSKVVTNDDLAQWMDTSDEWIRSRTGITKRRIAVTETGNDMASMAGQKALDNACIQGEDIELIIVATMSAEQSMPNVACEVQKQIGAKKAICFDMNAACSGFIFALHTATTYIQTGMVKNALIIGVERLSKLVNWEDRSTSVLFGDGAGAVVIAGKEGAIYQAVLGSNGNKGEALTCVNRENKTPYKEEIQQDTCIKMDGQEVFKFAVSTVPKVIGQVLEKAEVSVDMIDWFILHQANERILQSTAKRLNVPLDKFPMNLDHYGNTSAASIPLLLDEMNQKGQLKSGNHIVLSGFGGGLTWGAVYLQW